MVLIRVVLSLGVVVAGVFGYIEVFTKGVDRLPAKVCSGAVDREIAADVLPNTITASERGEKGIAYSNSRGTVFYCYVKTRSQDSILSGEVQINDVTSAKWREVHSEGDQEPREVRAKGVDVITTFDGVSVYVSCTRPDQNGQEPLQSYALIADARTIGDARVTGVELQQRVADFAYQILRHTYQVEECQEGQEFSDALPRFK
ncbi:hypothetical protein [Streptomyces sp. SM10]|uniref:hypothetical protein n=1 Tax=Streptomyces sp. SM10 TaxID=565556 RepID=UPI0011AFDDCC|nr:hypothetical protein [Streptomyces sp. SM10]